MRANYRKSPAGGGSQRHAKLGKRPPVGKQVGSSAVDNVKHTTFTNKSGNTENKTG